MQKQLITQSGGFPYLQMEKEVYHSSLDLKQKRERLERPENDRKWLLLMSMWPAQAGRSTPSATLASTLTLSNIQILKCCDSEFVPKLVATFETQNNYYLIQPFIS